MRTHGTRRLILVAAAALLAACGSDGDGDEGGAGGGGGEAAVVVELAALEVGDCVSPPDDSNFLGGAAVHRCDEPHAMQLLGRYELPDADAYPGSRVLGKQAYFDCIPLFEAYVGKPFWESEYDVRTVIPSVLSWDQGDREVLCAVVHPRGEPLTGSLKGAAR